MPRKYERKLRCLRFGKTAGKHVKFDRVHEHHGEDVKPLNDIKAANHPIDHLPYTALFIKYFFNGNMALFLLGALGMLIDPLLHLFSA